MKSYYNKQSKIKRSNIASLFLAFFFLVSFFAQAQNKKALDAFIPATTKAVTGAEITRVIAIIVRAVGGESGPAEKTQFDVILRSRIETNNLGEFSIIIPPQQLERLPDTFSLKIIIIPPKGWAGISSSNEATVKVKKSDGPKFEFVLLWQTEGDIKSNKGSFAVNAKSQN